VTSSRISVAASIAACLLLLIAFITSPAPFLHDFGLWLYQGKVIALKFIDPDQVAAYSLYNYPVPYVLVQYMMAALMLVLSPFVAGKLLLSIYLISWCWVSRLFVKRYFGDFSQQNLAWVLLACLAGLSSFFYYGFIGYQIGLLFFMWFLALYRSSTPVYLIALFGVVLFFAHAAIFLQFGLLIAVGVIIGRYPFRHFWALIPSGILSLLFLAGRFLGDSVTFATHSTWNSWLEAAIYKAGMITMNGPFKNFLLPDGSALLEGLPWLYWLGVGINIGTIFALGLFFLWVFARAFSGKVAVGSEGKNQTIFRFFAVALIAAYLLAPYHFFGIVHLGGRLVLPLFFVAIALAGSSLTNIPKSLGLVVAVATLATSSAYFVAVMPVTSVSDVDEGQASQPPAEVAKSVLAYNEWLYRNTRYSYYNYRIFAFTHRYQQLENHDYRGLGFNNGPLSGFAPAKPPKIKLSKSMGQ
jgi:hypothetical protein